MARGETASLSPDAYFDAGWFDRELETVFRSNWLYAGMLCDFPSDGNWVTVTYGSRSWIILRSEEGFRCFRNVCSHRHSRILSDRSGCGPLRCAYHGWTYGSNGVPTGLPGQRENFDLAPHERLALKLPEGRAVAIGNFVFFRDASDEDQPRPRMGDDAVSLLLNLSETFASPFEIGEHQWRANWKAGVENTLEPYHATFVHADSLAQIIDLRYHTQLETRFNCHRHELREASVGWWSKMLGLAGIEKPRNYSDYWHFHIHPNLCIGLTNGSLLSIQSFEPVSTESVCLRFRLFLPDGPRGQGNEVMATTLKRFLSEYNAQILAEDREPVEACQVGIRDAAGKALLGESEARIGSFQRDLLADMGLGLVSINEARSTEVGR
jgi:choline monooxygenase